MGLVATQTSCSSGRHRRGICRRRNSCPRRPSRAEEAVFIADAGREPHPSLDGEGTFERDLGIDPRGVLAVEQQDLAEDAAELLLEFGDGGIIAEHGGEALDGGAVEVGLRERFVEQGGDDGLRAGFAAGERVEGAAALRRLKRGIEREELRSGIGCA
jgi:hypothetical protein